MTVECAGFYPEAMEFNDEKANRVGDGLYYVTPTKVYRISRDVSLGVSRSAEFQTIEENDTITLNLNKPPLELCVGIKGNCHFQTIDDLTSAIKSFFEIGLLSFGKLSKPDVLPSI